MVTGGRRYIWSLWIPSVRRVYRHATHNIMICTLDAYHDYIRSSDSIYVKFVTKL